VVRWPRPVTYGDALDALRDAYLLLGLRHGIGLALLPDSELPNFRLALAWIREAIHAGGNIPVHPLVRTFVPGPMPNNLFTLIVWRRKDDSLKVPYASFAMTYGNEMIRVFLPSPERNANVTGQQIRLYRFPHVMDLAYPVHGESQTEVLDMSGTTIRKGETMRATMTYDSAIDRHPSE